MILKQLFNQNNLLKSLMLFIAACIWLPCIHFFYKPDIREYRSNEGISLKARMIAASHLEIWTDPELRELEFRKMRAQNPEWDFMSRTYFVLALANMSLRDEKYKQQSCEIIDAILDNTLRIEREKEFYQFLLDYGYSDSWVMRPPRSQFIDGEIALMLAARRLIEEKAAYIPLLSERVEIMVSRMRQSPVLCAESYPNEYWVFCNTMSLAAIRMADVLDGTDHSAFLSSWINTAKKKLTESESGLLISAFDVNGTPVLSGFGPEGTSIWMACNMLQIVDRKFAEDQYRRARKELFDSFLGFGYSREWPTSSVGVADVDSGPIIPYLGASASASGLALIAAAGFDDTEFFSSLITSLNFAGFPTEKDGKLSYEASNPVGDAVMLYAIVEGPLWNEVERRSSQWIITRKTAQESRL
ncbi:hypothetical protein QUF72_10165 [Desulfobacterales bacterium HSG2]|nr:hypothetical protein [Desulfobacterales bacterium HSG2]